LNTTPSSVEIIGQWQSLKLTTDQLMRTPWLFSPHCVASSSVKN